MVAVVVAVVVAAAVVISPSSKDCFEGEEGKWGVLLAIVFPRRQIRRGLTWQK